MKSMMAATAYHQTKNKTLVNSGKWEIVFVEPYFQQLDCFVFRRKFQDETFIVKWFLTYCPLRFAPLCFVIT